MMGIFIVFIFSNFFLRLEYIHFISIIKDYQAQKNLFENVFLVILYLKLKLMINARIDHFFSKFANFFHFLISHYYYQLDLNFYTRDLTGSYSIEVLPTRNIIDFVIIYYKI